MEIFEKVHAALQMCGYPLLKSREEIRFLGEGAWHEAYLLEVPGQGKMVIRFPKPVAYGRTVEFNEQAMRSEYAAVGYFYEKAWEVAPGICPQEYQFRVRPELTFTLESYMGEPIRLAEIDLPTAFACGKQVGEFFRAMADMPAELSGFGHLDWKEGRLVGRFDGDGQQNVREEKGEYAKELEVLLQSDLSFDRETVQRLFTDCIEKRTVGEEPITLVNQDTSPENLLLSSGQVRLIDPFPLLYNSTIYAANFVCNYRYLFPRYYNSPRYERHRFDLHAEQLSAIAEGFLSGFAAGSEERQQAVMREVFLLLLSLTHQQYSVLQSELSTEQSIRMGSQAAIAERLTLFFRDLEAFEIG